jgi:hypothetical protein
MDDRGIEVRPARRIMDSWLMRRVGGSTRAWISNRWHWRDKRRVREETARLQALVVQVEDLQIPMTESVRRAAVVCDALGFSAVLHYGYGMGEAVAVAASMAPTLVEPLANACRDVTDDQLFGRPDTDFQRAVRCRNDLIDVVRRIVSANPKPGA